jgi:hypothetical protein
MLILALLILFPLSFLVSFESATSYGARRVARDAVSQQSPLPPNVKSDVHNLLTVINLAAQRANCKVSLVQSERM